MTASSTATDSRMPALLELGQSVWLDYIRRGMLRIRRARAPDRATGFAA